MNSINLLDMRVWTGSGCVKHENNFLNCKILLGKLEFLGEKRNEFKKFVCALKYIFFLILDLIANVNSEIVACKLVMYSHLHILVSIRELWNVVTVYIPDNHLSNFIYKMNNSLLMDKGKWRFCCRCLLRNAPLCVTWLFYQRMWHTHTHKQSDKMFPFQKAIRFVLSVTNNHYILQFVYQT